MNTLHSTTKSKFIIFLILPWSFANSWSLQNTVGMSYMNLILAYFVLLPEKNAKFFSNENNEPLDQV